VVYPQQIAGSLGAEILRLWVGTTDYSGELSIDDKILKGVVEAYRRIRNTLRFLLANISDFDPKRHAVEPERMVEIDRYAIALAAKMQDTSLADYERYQFHLVTRRIQVFCSEDLGAFYLDVLKDRLYTCGAESHPRRSAQTALYHITQSLVRLMAPVLSFTAEEVWREFTRNAADDSVFFQTAYRLPPVADGAALLEKWTRLRELRGPVRKEIEDLRAAGKVGSSLQAEVEFQADGADYDLLASLGDDLKFLMLTSSARVSRSAEANVGVKASSYPKCERCWHYRPDVNDEGLCGRCQSNLRGPGETRKHV
jgi:isoleucyl-tRNA synthetase